MHYSRLLLICYFALCNLQSAFNQSVRVSLAWIKPVEFSLPDGKKNSYLSFENAMYDQNTLQTYFLISKKVPLNTESISLILSEEIYVPLSDTEKNITKTNKIASDFKVKYDVVFSIIKKEKYAYIKLFPIRINSSSNQTEKLTSFLYSIQENYSTNKFAETSSSYASNSVLANGTWFKIGVTKDGIFKIDYNLISQLGMDPASINPGELKVYGNGGGQLPYANSKKRPDDLLENAVFVFDQQTTGVFDSLDYVLFYGQSQNRWDYDSASACNKFTHNVHQFSDTTFYFLTPDNGVSKKIQQRNASTSSPGYLTTTYDDYAFHENDATNLIKSDREWYGEKFDIINSHSFNFNFPSIDLSSSVSVFAQLLGRADVQTDYNLSLLGTSTLITTPPTTTSLYYSAYGTLGNGCVTVTPASSSLNVNVSRISPTNNSIYVGYVDYVVVNARRTLIYSGNQLLYRDSKSIGTGKISQFSIANANNKLKIWDVTNPSDVVEQKFSISGTTALYVLPTDSLLQFVLFDSSSVYTPFPKGSVPNQNLHSVGATDYIIVTHPLFYDDAVTLANFHTSNHGLRSVVVTPQQIYNEFSSGAQDISAIRDFLRMLYKRAANSNDLPKYLLLYGDGSYDNKNRLLNNTNYIPTFQAHNSLDPIRSYVSDDFYALLDDSEGEWLPAQPDQPDLGVGRFPVKTLNESHAILNKVIKYMTAPGFIPTSSTVCSGSSSCSNHGDWRNNVTFLADDEDFNIHLSQADNIATMIDTACVNYNIDKIYFDAYKQESTPGGSRYPDVVNAINKKMERGCLIFNYTGHGGELGLGHERVIEINQINSWKNNCNPPLFFTATCEFSRYDDPGRTSAGEYCFLNPNGGAIGLMSTVRLVFSGPNFVLNKNFFKYALDTMSGGKIPRLGDLYFLTKTTIAPDENNRNFSLLCDPALMLAYPKYNVVTTTINGNIVTTGISDTVQALSKVTITGEVRDVNGNKLSNYNGLLYPTIYDKKAIISTLSNDGPSSSPVTKFSLQKNILYKGKVSVLNGDFIFSFVIPKDISYQFGKGKISYYLDNGFEDGSGSYEEFIIGGTNPNPISDNEGPEINLYMNDDKFVYGGMTNSNPRIYAIVKDSNGVNTIGNGIGHDIIATLDGSTDNEIVLNEYYESDIDSYSSGKINYQLSDLAPGKHALKLKVWDVYNNSNYAYTEFIVAESAILALSHVLNYPNPFTTKTSFYFEHNQACSELKTQIQIFTISGKLVKTINTSLHSNGFRSDGIDWDGRDDFGDRLAKGVYVYKVKVISDNGEVAEKFEKLVILK